MANVVTVTVASTDRTAVIPWAGGGTGGPPPPIAPTPPIRPFSEGGIRIEVTSPGTATCHIQIYDQTNAVTFGDNDLVVVTDPTTPGHNAFQGYVKTRRADLEANYRIWTVDCIDLNDWLDKKIVGAPDGTQFLESPPGTYKPYDPNAITQGSDSATISHLFSVYAPDLPVDTSTFVQTLVPTIAKPIRWNTVTLRRALDDLAGLASTALRFWIDADWMFHWTIVPTSAPVVGTAIGPLLRLFPPPAAAPPAAPQALTDGPANGTTTYNYEALQVTWDDTAWADSIYVNGATDYTLEKYWLVNYVGGGLYNPDTRVDGVYSTSPATLPPGTHFLALPFFDKRPGSSTGYFHIVGGFFAGYWMPNLASRAVRLSPDQTFVHTGGSGWVNGIGPTGRQTVLTLNNSDSQTLRDSIGGLALANTTRATIRASANIYTTTGGWVPGQVVTLTNTPLALTSQQYLLQKVTTEFLSGNGQRRLALEFGDAPAGTIGLRRAAQIPPPPGSGARRPAAAMVVTVSNSAPGISGVVRCYAQAVDQSGNPWPIAGKSVTWTYQAYDTGGNNVSLAGYASFSAVVTTTDVAGSTWVDMELGNVNNITYFATATLSDE